MSRRSDDEGPPTTLDGVADVPRARRARNLRRVGITLLAATVAAACLGWLGPRDTTARASDGEVEASLTYPQITRAGADSALALTLRLPADSGFTVRVPRRVIERLGLETLSPEPSGQTASGDDVLLTYEPPPDPELTWRFGGRMPVRAGFGRLTYDVAVSVDGGSTAVLSVRTWVLP